MTSTREAMTLLRAANPMQNELSPTAAQPDVPRQTYAPRRRRSRLAVAVAGVAAIGVVALGLGVVPLPWTHGSASPAAAAALDKAARAADITARDEVARPDQYWRIRTVGIYLGYSSMVTSKGQSSDEAIALERTTRTEYVSVDGSRPTWFVDTPRKVVRVLVGRLPTDVHGAPPAGQTWTTDLSPNQTPGSWQTPNPAWLAALPRDTDALRDRLYADTDGHGRSHDGEVLVYVADVLRSGLVPADLRAALFRVLETVPGVDVVKRHEDGLISIGRFEDKDGQRQEIVIDPKTGEYVGERAVQVEAMDGIPAGTVVEDATVSRTLVDSVPRSVAERATHYVCTVSDGGGVGCQVG